MFGLGRAGSFLENIAKLSNNAFGLRGDKEQGGEVHEAIQKVSTVCDNLQNFFGRNLFNPIAKVNLAMHMAEEAKRGAMGFKSNIPDARRVDSYEFMDLDWETERVL